MAKNRQQLDAAFRNIDTLYAYMTQQGAQIAELSRQLNVCQGNCYVLYLQLELMKKERQAEAFGMTEELQNEIDTLRCDIEDELRRQEEVTIIEGENPQGWGESNG